MTPVRPTSLPAVTPATQAPRNDARTAAQRAFFEAALGKASGAPAAATPAAVRNAPAVQTAPAAVPAVRAQAVQTAQPATDDPPKKILRPGSILNILV